MELMDQNMNSSVITNNTNYWNNATIGTTQNLNNTRLSNFGIVTTVINMILNSTMVTNSSNLTTVLNNCSTNDAISILNITGTENRTGFDFNTSGLHGDILCTKNTIHDENDDDFAGFISDDTLDIVVLVDYVFVSGIICGLGIVFNIINAIIFYRLGFGDTVNIMLFSLALTDLGALAPLLWKALLFNPLFHNWDAVTFDYQTFQYYTGGWPHACFANTSCLIIAFVTLDRCLCITMPLKVRTIITPRRTVITIVIFFVILAGSIIPLFSTVKFGPVFFDDKNTSLISLIYSDDAAFVENITLSFYTVNQIAALVAVILFTAILVVQLKKKSAWRMKTSTAGGSASNNTGRDTKVVKMVLFIAIIYIICYVPGAVSIVVMMFVPEYSLIGTYKNVCTLVWAKLNILEAFNSTINIFIYIKMSSKYAQAFNKMFGRADDLDGKGRSATERSGCHGNTMTSAVDASVSGKTQKY